MEPTGTPNPATSDHRRRSTRIPQPVLLNISGQNKVGNPVSELTYSVAVSFHGCLYSSRHDYRPGSWVTLEAAGQKMEGKLRSMRALVKYVGLPRSPRDLYRVGVELETPANIWGIEPVPEDWLPYSDSARVAAGAAQAARSPLAIQTAPPIDQQKHIPPDSNEFVVSAPALSIPDITPSEPSLGKVENATTPPDELIRAWEKALQEEADGPEASAVASHVNTAAKKAAKATEIANQESILKIAGSVRHCDTLLIPARVGFLSRLNSELADFGERLFEHAAAFVTRTERAFQGLDIENAAAEIQPTPMEVGTFSKKLVSGQVNVRAGRDIRYRIKVDASKMPEPAVTGWFRASGGSKNDIALVLATEYEFENLIHGHEARVLFATDSITTGEFHVSITQSGTYILALNNRFSLFMPRTFVANIDLRYSTPRQSSSATEAPAAHPESRTRKDRI